MTADVSLCARELLRFWENGRDGDLARRRECRRRLAELRQRWRSDASIFEPETLLILKTVADGLDAAPLAAPLDILRQVFGYQAFRPGQEEIIDSVLAGKDCVGIMPTGAGKSLTYQVPARVLGGTTLVISPLISLMKDQVDAMTEVGIEATFLNSSLTSPERRQRKQQIQAGAFELVYLAPEGLESSLSVLTDSSLSLIAIDEAHCISHWGHDFRPAYRSLSGLKNRFGGLPILALTATATAVVARDIITQLAMAEPSVHRGSFFRDNLHIHAYKKGGGRPTVRKDILRWVRSQPGESGIIYCLARKTVESLSAFLVQQGIRARPYHAGMSSADRTLAQEAFQHDRVDVMVATIAFGMGIDKSNVRYVIHRDMPKSIEGYYQEIGRAGRDGLLSHCILFYSWADVKSYERFIRHLDPEIAETQSRQLRQMYRFAEGNRCRHQGLAAYFGERIVRCGVSCDVCDGRDLLDELPSASPGRSVARARPARGQAPRGTEGELFEALRALRRAIADDRGVPAYLVFSDATLLDMTRRRPSDEAALLDVSGVGPTKLDRYGKSFLDAIASFRERQDSR